MVVPDLPPEIRGLKARARRFVEEELYPAEARIAERGSVDEDEIEALREQARAQGFSNYNLPAEHGGTDLPMLAQVAIEEEAGRATNGLGFIVAERGPREILEIASPEQLERFIGPLSKPAVLAGCVIIALPMFGDYYTPDLLSGSPNTSLLGNQIDLYIRGGQQVPVGAALVVCLMLLLAVFMAYYLYATSRAERRLGR